MIWNPSPTVLGVLSYLASNLWSSPASPPPNDTERWNCRPFLPTLFVETPPSPGHPAIRAATKLLDDYLASKYAQGSIDSLSIAVITSAGTLYERNFGVLRANETNSPPTTSHSSYRIASVSKLFTVLEGFILEQRGVISWCVTVTALYRLMLDSPSSRILGTIPWTSTSKTSSIAWIVLTLDDLT